MTDKTDREIMQQSLEALDYISRRDYDDTPLHDYELAKMRPAMSALRERLAQPEQEPVSVIKRNEAGQITMQTPDGNPFDMSKYIGAKLYSAPPEREWQGLTDEEKLIDFAMMASGCIADKSFDAVKAPSERLAQPDPMQRFTDVQQEIEAALAQPEQGPVAYVLRTLSGKSISDEIAPTGWSTFESKIEKLRADPWVQNGIAEIVPLYTAPQRREWQGLTNEEISAISKSIPGETVLGAAMRLFAREIEAKLKAKNT